jgi:CheY-like chemotaxis protein
MIMDKRILVLDDNEDILEVVTAALTYERYLVLGLSLGTQLFQAVRDFKPDLILLDFLLADADGVDLCRQLKADIEYRHIPVLIFSAYFSPGQRLPVDCDGFLYKPFDLAELFNAVQTLLPATTAVSY